jgi:type VI secretion system protein ImpA
MEFESELARLAEPIAPGAPCGESLEDTPTLAAFDAYRLFGQLTAPQSDPDWRELRSASLAALAQSKDFRVLAYFAAAVAHSGQLAEVLQVFPLIQQWLELYWDEVYPRLDGDAIMRKNAISDFADRIAVLDGLRRLPLIAHPQLGSFSLRDIDIISGAQPNPDKENQPRSQSELDAALKMADVQSLARFASLAAQARASLLATQEIMRTRGGNSSATPQLEALIAQCARIQQILGPRLAESAGSEAQTSTTEGGAASGSSAVIAVGAVKSRQDAVRALESVAEYFRRNEPTSPVALLIERAKRMVSMDFLQVIAELAPDALDQARKAAGVRDE